MNYIKKTTNFENKKKVKSDLYENMCILLLVNKYIFPPYVNSSSLLIEVIRLLV